VKAHHRRRALGQTPHVNRSARLRLEGALQANAGKIAGPQAIKPTQPQLERTYPGAQGRPEEMFALADVEGNSPTAKVRWDRGFREETTSWGFRTSNDG
jgi:hypothetical protein